MSDQSADNKDFQDLVAPDGLVGSVVNEKYKIVSRIGAGGMGTVYRGEDLYIGRPIAIKFLKADLLESSEYLERFKREAMIASRLNHPNAITMFDYGVFNSSPYLVMQFVEGKTLKEILLEGGALPLDRVLNILKQVGAALFEAHSMGVVHRDLKPDNIMLSHMGNSRETAKILDFGIAKPLSIFGDSGGTELTRAGAFMGTPLYMSPEQAMDRPCDARSDIYALGIILYEMLTGEVPFKSSSPVELLVRHINDVPRSIKDFKPDLNVPQAISDVVAKALEKDPSNRFQSIDELVQEFSKASIGHVKRQPFAVGAKPAAAAITKPTQNVKSREERVEESSAKENAAQLEADGPRVDRAVKKSAVGSGAIFGVIAALSIAGVLVYHHYLAEPEVDVENQPVIEQSAEVSLAAENEKVLTSSEKPEEVSAKLDPGQSNSEVNAYRPEATIVPIEKSGSATLGQSQELAKNEVGARSGRSSSDNPAVVEVVVAGNSNLGGSALTESSNPEPAQPITSTSSVDGVSSPGIVVTNQELFEAVTEVNRADGNTNPPTPEVAVREEDLDAYSLSAIKAAISSRPDRDDRKTSDKLYDEGRELFNSAEYNASAAKFKQAVITSPSNLGARLSLASSLLRLGASEQALEHFQAADSEQRDYPPTLYGFASYYAVKGDATQALTYLKRAIALYPKIKSWPIEDVDFNPIRNDPDFIKLLGK